MDFFHDWKIFKYNLNTTKCFISQSVEIVQQISMIKTGLTFPGKDEFVSGDSDMVINDETFTKIR